MSVNFPDLAPRLCPQPMQGAILTHSRGPHTYPPTSGCPHFRNRLWPRVGRDSRTWGPVLRGQHSSFHTPVRGLLKSP